MGKKKDEGKGNKVSVSEMTKYAKKLGVKVKGKDADEIKELILDAIEEAVMKAKKKDKAKKWAKENKDLVAFHEKFVDAEKEKPESKSDSDSASDSDKKPKSDSDSDSASASDSDSASDADPAPDFGKMSQKEMLKFAKENEEKYKFDRKALKTLSEKKLRKAIEKAVTIGTSDLKEAKEKAAKAKEKAKAKAAEKEGKTKRSNKDADGFGYAKGSVRNRFVELLAKKEKGITLEKLMGTKGWTDESEAYIKKTFKELVKKELCEEDKKGRMQLSKKGQKLLK